MTRSDRLPAYAAFAAILSAAGLPIYMYAPKFYAENYGVGLAALGAVLFGLRLFDMVQDPILGWIGERLTKRRGMAVAGAGAVMAAAMIGLFAVAPPVPAVLWFGLTLTALFTSFSFLTILFYATGIAKADRMTGGHMRLAGWRESGALLGICLAAVAPVVLATYSDRPFAVFAFGFAVLAAVAVWAMSPEWGNARVEAVEGDTVTFRTILQDQIARRLLILAFINATPLAISSTLFLFYVENRLDAPGWEGGLLVLFFLSAAGSAPVWGKVASIIGAKSTLLFAMALSIAGFGWALTLGAGDQAYFSVICLVTGAAIGADLTLLPAMFARRMAAIAPQGGQGFGLWGLVSKFTLAFAAVLLLPLLQHAGFVAGAATQPAKALDLLAFLYAGVPTLLKLCAMAVLAATKKEDLG